MIAIEYMEANESRDLLEGTVAWIKRIDARPAISEYPLAFVLAAYL